jgi:hypothetical protein
MAGILSTLKKYLFFLKKYTPLEKISYGKGKEQKQGRNHAET